ncbi:MAG: type IV toxin-antitoxin system AbiEi family antitoxin domain-containing protein [Candidatus Limnocylindrales bacterium]
MTLASYATLAGLGPTLTTGEAAAALRISTSAASRLLSDLATHGLARRVRHGLWVLGNDPVNPRRLAEEVTRPYPAYISFTSALNFHQLIDQLPRDISVASLDRSKRVRTAMATFVVHHLPPDLFGGWVEMDGIKLANPEKALFDLCYVSAVHGGRPPRIPELEPPKAFDRADLDRWLERVGSPRLRTLTSRGLEYALSRAVR